jgi:excisionase family DNA binding protein
MEPKYLKIGRAADMIDVSPWTLRSWIKNRKIRVYRFGRAIRIRESDLFAFAEVQPGLSKTLKNE